MKYQNGQTLIEAIVALATILLIITAISTVVVSGLYNSQFVKNQNEANKYAQEGMEFVRNIQKNNLPDFATYQQIEGTYCVDEVENELTTENCHATNVNTGGSYNRIITFSPGAGQCVASEVKVTVKVSWTSSKCTGDAFCHKSELVSCMPYMYPGRTP